MKGKRVIAGILLAGILAVTLAGCKNTDNTKEKTEKPVITLGSDNYPPYNYLNEDGVPTGIDVELATEAFKRMGCFCRGSSNGNGLGRLRQRHCRRHEDHR